MCGLITNFFFNDTATTEIYTLSLHDALPIEAPPIDPRNIIMVLGTADDVTPFLRGAALAKRWKIPPESLFLRPMGHFSAALDLIRDPAPLRHLAERLRKN